MVRKTHMRKTHKRKSHTRRHTRKRGGACPCAAVNRSLQAGGRGGMGGASVGHAYTTGASQELKQLSPSPLSSGGKGSSARRRTRNAWLYEKNAKKRALLKAIAQNASAEGQRRQTRREIPNRHNKFSKVFVKGMPLMGYEGNAYKHLSRNEMKNKIREEAISEYVRMFGDNEGFNELNLELNNNNNNNRD